MKTSIKIFFGILVVGMIALTFGCFSVPTVAPRRSFSATSLLEDAITNKIVSTVPIFSFNLPSGDKVDLYKVSNLDDLTGTWIYDPTVNENGYLGYGTYSDCTLTYPSAKKGKGYADLSLTVEYGETLEAGAVLYAAQNNMTEDEAIEYLWKEIISENKNDPDFTYTKGAPYRCTEKSVINVEDSIAISKGKNYIYFTGSAIVLTKK